ncbi:MAG: PorT family protein, partial [Chitinophagaceae bacterium]|nr:PorT family protein [Chitinophagaceae bacterium]
MKRIAFFTLAAFCAFPFVMQAQISIGAHAGIHSNNVQIKGIADSWLPENRYWTGAQAGLFVELPLTENLSFQPGLQYIEKGFRVKEGFDFNIGAIPVPIGAEAITRLQYIEMPMLMKYTFGESIIKPYV